jgi:uncharacterized protein (DUF983 family)
MTIRYLEPNNLGTKDDWFGNNAAFKCPVCGNTFIVSAFSRNSRKCTNCGKSTGYCKGGKDSDGTAYIEW